MPWKDNNHLSMRKPATAAAECKEDIFIVLSGGPGASCVRGMTNETGNLPDSRERRRYTWPWFVLAAVLLAIALAVLWMSREVERARRIHAALALANQDHLLPRLGGHLFDGVLDDGRVRFRPLVRG